MAISTSQLQEIRGYCSQCSCYCPTVATVENGKFLKVRPDKEHPNAIPLCVKGLAGPELIHSPQRLQYPMRRTRPKGNRDSGWKRISWDEALDITAAKLNEIKQKYGPEAVAFTRAGPGGSPMSEVFPWLSRLSNAFGSPNFVATTHICQWHRDHGSAFTYGRAGMMGTQGRPQYEKAKCTLIWGCDVHATRQSVVPMIEKGLREGGKLIVIDSRKIKLTDMADLWLQIRPATDGALALSLINVVIEEKLYAPDFVRDWTTAPLLVRSDNGNFLRGGDLSKTGDPLSYVALNSQTGQPILYVPGLAMPAPPVIEAEVSVKLASGSSIRCKTVFRLLRERASSYPPEAVSGLTSIPAKNIRQAAQMFATIKPACWYSYNGIEETTNATQTNRAICILYALTGNYDIPGGNVISSPLPLKPIDGREFLTPEAQAKTLGIKERPLGPPATAQSIIAYDVYKAVLTGKPYPVRGLVGFGGNMVISGAPSIMGREALCKLDFHVQAELFLSPTAELADIVLPVASFWESWHAKIQVESGDTTARIQLRPAVVPPQHESWPDLKIAFELGRRLGLGDKFWDGDVEAGFNHFLSPSGVTVEQLRQNPGGVFIPIKMEYQKYRRQDSAGRFTGFVTPTKRMELYSQLFKEHGYDPLPAWQKPDLPGPAKEYPLTLIGYKMPEFCHSQYRALPSIRKLVPHPYLQIHPDKAREIGCADGEWVILETVHGAITVQAKLTKGIAPDVVCAQHGWWQSCDELGLPGYDPYSPEGANANLLYVVDKIDAISGSIPVKGYPCNVRKK